MKKKSRKPREHDEKDQQQMFYNDLEALIGRYYEEFDLSYESIIGVLTRRVVSTVLEDIEAEEAEDDDEDLDFL
jgi:hypothetical protein|tara:strand:- start:984 stop:1205 length:222 start_codon:yes stop_codon:yes gene_type:complete